MTDLAGIADELYGLTTDEFTAARNDRAAAVRSDGDKALADELRRLPKPSATAWVVNMLVRHRAAEIGEVLELGASLREAQGDLDRDALRSLTSQRRQLVGALTRQAVALAAELGHKVSATVSTEVEQTLQAAMTDQDAATAVRSGRLVRSLATVGFEPVDLAGAVAVPEAGMRASGPVPKARKPDDSAARELAEARQELGDAEREAAEAAHSLDDVHRQLAAATRQRDDLEAELVQLEQRMRDLESRIADSDRAARALARERDRASRAAEAAGREAERARAKLDDLGEKA